MPVPRAARQTALVDELTLALHQLRIHGAQCRRVRPGFRSGRLVAIGGARQRRDGVLERREVQRRGHVLDRRNRPRLLRIVHRRKHAVRNLAVAFAHVVLTLAQQCLQLAQIGLRGVGQVGEFERQHVGIRETNHEAARELGERAAVEEARVRELREAIEVVVDGVVDAVVVEATERQVQRRDAVVLEERRVVRARAERTDAQVSA